MTQELKNFLEDELRKAIRIRDKERVKVIQKLLSNSKGRR
jgi:uncharacterized protein (UPF0216 family)